MSQTKEIKIENYSKRNSLIANEQDIQKKWDFSTKPNEFKKFFGTFPFAYQNGVMHLGHAYTMSKLEFKARFMKLKGYNVLFPIGFHGTGMPIVACANRLKESLSIHNITTLNIDTLPINDQIKILYNMGIPLNEISKFIDPYYWLTYFPQRSIYDLKKFGICADFSRSFITTDINPYYDLFVKWQFNILNSKGYLKFGKKPIIYSPKDKQTCADHDRSKGEGINPKKYNMYLSNIQSENECISKYSNIWIVLTDDRIVTNNIKSVIVHANDDFVIGLYNDNYIIARQAFFRNFKYQVDNEIKIFESIKGIHLQGSIIKIGDIDLKIQDSKVQNITGSGFKILIKNSRWNRKSFYLWIVLILK